MLLAHLGVDFLGMFENGDNVAHHADPHVREDPLQRKPQNRSPER